MKIRALVGGFFGGIFLFTSAPSTVLAATTVPDPLAAESVACICRVWRAQCVETDTPAGKKVIWLKFDPDSRSTLNPNKVTNPNSPFHNEDRFTEIKISSKELCEKIHEYSGGGRSGLSHFLLPPCNDYTTCTERKYTDEFCAVDGSECSPP